VNFVCESGDFYGLSRAKNSQFKTPRRRTLQKFGAPYFVDWPHRALSPVLQSCAGVVRQSDRRMETLSDADPTVLTARPGPELTARFTRNRR